VVRICSTIFAHIGAPDLFERGCMKKALSTKYLCSEENGQQLLRSFSGRAIPGRTFTLDEDEKISLAGGFANLSPDTLFFLSPTLQLNGDLGAYSDNELLGLAKAELRRFQAIQYRSYQVDTDSRVCVVSTDAEALDTFIDTYGGVLEIEPLLLGASHSEYPSLTELEFDSASDGCKLRYRKQSPVKMDKCCYCGNCGAVCPENCISAELYVDYSRCTFCKECEKVCADNAMDIYGIEEIELQVPAVIMLGKPGIALPENSTSIYQENQITEFFKTVYAAEIKEVVCHNNSICQYSSRLGYGCARCVDSCPHGAISQGKSGIVVNHVECRECGKCIAVCPTGAMQNGNFTDAELVNYLQNIDHQFVEELVIGEEQQLHELWWRKGRGDSRKTFYLEYSSLGSLSIFHLLLFFASGFQRVVLLADDSSENLSGLRQQTATVNTIIESLFQLGFAELLGIDEYLANTDQAGSLSLKVPLKLTSYGNRRSALSQIFQHLLADSGKVLTAAQTGNLFSAITCDSGNCTQCLACLNECRMQALSADQDNLSLVYDSGLCVGCGVCVRVCPEKVLSMDEGYAINANFFTKQILAQAEPVKCKECGKVFGTRKSLDRVMRILTARETVNTDHFEYCSTCRVVKLFEVEGA
jgi:ferredoxin